MDCVGEGQMGFCVDALTGYCGGAPPPMISTCRYDACAADADCDDGTICAPGGFPGAGRVVNYCLRAQCATDAECSARAGGQCVLLSDAPHCYGTYGFTCTYADDPCRGHGDCDLGSSCVVTADGTECQEAQPVP
jgi:hypothetical protein